ncbi:hypothetical protein M422DRAFT_126211, partial [Sphaerobolus stellatus SS14]
FSHLLCISFTQSANGWTDNYICHQWFEKAFIPFAKAHNVSGKPLLVLSDRHQSHETPEMHRLAFANDIILLSLPPHTTHKLQPPDVGVFGPFQGAWIKHCEHAAITRNSVTQYNFVRNYMEVRTRSASSAIISSAFRKSGIWPFNSEIFTDEDFAPSQHFSTVPVMPATFP